MFVLFVVVYLLEKRYCNGQQLIIIDERIFADMDN